MVQVTYTPHIFWYMRSSTIINSVNFFLLVAREYSCDLQSEVIMLFYWNKIYYDIIYDFY